VRKIECGHEVIAILVDKWKSCFEKLIWICVIFKAIMG
jgi:hypothetical protein